MASADLVPFATCPDLSIVVALDTPASGVLHVGYWISDPLQQIIWPEALAGHPRRDYLWQQTCFELFVGVHGQDDYREINLSPAGSWQAYAFEEYRYPESNPPALASDIQLIELARTRFGLTAAVDVSRFLQQHGARSTDLYCGVSAVIQTHQQHHYFALQHSLKAADFHNKRDWLINLA